MDNMTKKIASQNNSEALGKDDNKLEKSSESMENSTNLRDLKKTVNNNQKNEYIYSTPLKKIKLNIPMTPKKKRKYLDVNDYNIRGKNLLSLFQLVE